MHVPSLIMNNSSVCAVITMFVFIIFHRNNNDILCLLAPIRSNQFCTINHFTEANVSWKTFHAEFKSLLYSIIWTSFAKWQRGRSVQKIWKANWIFMLCESLKFIFTEQSHKKRSLMKRNNWLWLGTCPSITMRERVHDHLVFICIHMRPSLSFFCCS